MNTVTVSQAAKIDAIRQANAALANAGMPSYTELLGTLLEARKLGLRFDIGTAYIRRAYIDHQDELNDRIDSARDAAHAAANAA